MRVLVTGSKGFIGRNLCLELRRRGIKYHAADLPSVDIRRFDVLSHVASTCDVVIHLAAISGFADCEEDVKRAISTNVLGTYMVSQLERRTVFASSGAVYGGVPDGETYLTECCPLMGDNLYATTKRLGEQLCDVSLRFSNVFGPHSLHKGSAVHAFIQKALDGEPLEVHGDGQQVRDFLYVEDLVDALILAAESDYCGELNISSGKGRSVRGVANAIAELMDAEIESVPGRPGDAPLSVLSNEKAKQKLGWTPSWDFRGALAKTIEWYREHAS